MSGVSFAVWAPNASRVSVVGDFNAYGKEDPIDDFTSNGFVDQIGRFNTLGYSYVFDGAAGTDTLTDFETGLYTFETIKPGPVAGRRGLDRQSEPRHHDGRGGDVVEVAQMLLQVFQGRQKALAPPDRLAARVERPERALLPELHAPLAGELVQRVVNFAGPFATQNYVVSRDDVAQSLESSRVPKILVGYTFKGELAYSIASASI